MYEEFRVSFLIAFVSAAILSSITKHFLLDVIVYEFFSGPVTHLLQTFLPGRTFAPIVTRDFRPPKPEPHGILHIAEAWGLEDGGDGLIMVRLHMHCQF